MTIYKIEFCAIVPIRKYLKPIFCDLPLLDGAPWSRGVSMSQKATMFRAIGFLIILWGLSLYFSNSFLALDSAATESFRAIEFAAVVSQSELQNRI
jgi:hypothetical protein